MIEAHQLTRHYGPTVAVDDVSFSVGEQEIVGILGPNGAGKTTTLRMLTGFLPPTEGSVAVAGYDLLEEPLRARRELGYLPENVALYPEMRVEEYLVYRAHLHGLGRADARSAIGEAMERCLVEDVRGKLIGTLSKGYRQRVGLAQAILHRPRVLVLDEPTVGLDPKQIVAIRELIQELAREGGRRRALLLSTHILPEVELLCDRVLIIDGGRLVGEGTPEDLRARLRRSSRVVVELDGAPGEAEEVLARVPGAAAVRPVAGRPGRWRVEGADDADPRREIFRAVVERGWVLLAMEEERASLEDVFIRLTTREEAKVDAEGGADPPPAEVRGAEPPAAPDDDEEVAG